MASKEPAPCCFVDRATWELFSLVDLMGKRNGQVMVMEVHDNNLRTSVLANFAQDLCGTVDIRAKLQQTEKVEEVKVEEEELGGAEKEELGDEEEKEEDNAQPHLIFMLWSPTLLKELMQWDYLGDALCNLRNLLPFLPDVLVLVMVRPGPQEQLDQAMRALRRMQCLLDGAWELVVETAIYSPGQPDDILETKRAACRALREVLNCHEEVDSKHPFTVSFPEFSFCCILPEHLQHTVSKTDAE